jgi:hypothetical protein
VNARDDVLRAAVYDAHRRRGTPEFRLACERVVDVHRLWPLIEFEHAIEQARESMKTLERRSAASLQLLRETGEVLRG